MPAVLEKPPCTHREDTPVRICHKCGCYLRSTNPSTTCDPCGTPPWELVEEGDVFDAIAEAPGPYRERIIDALERIWESTL